MNLNPFKRTRQQAPVEPEKTEDVAPKYSSQLISNVAPDPVRSDIVVHEPLPGVVPSGEREAVVKLASDSMPTMYMATGGFTGGFLGYPYLADLAQRPEYRNMVETVAEEMTRKWIELKAHGDEDKSERIERLSELLDEFEVKDTFRKAIEDDGYFGRGQIYLDVKTPSGKRADEAEGEMATPLFLSASKIKKGSLQGIRTIEPQWTYPSAYQAEKPWAADFYKPQRWYVMGQQIHDSRFCMIVSRPVPDVLKAAYNFGGLSLSQMAEPYVNNWIRTRNSVSDLIHSFSLTVLATDLDTMVQSGGSELIRRLDLFTKLRDNRGIFAINKNDESIEQHNTPLSGLSDLQAQSLEHLSYVTKEPLVKLTGITPSGLNATSDGEIRVWYDHVHARQEDDIRPGLKRILDILQLHEFGDIDEAITFDFVPLHELSEDEESQIRERDSKTAGNYVELGAISPDEVRQQLSNDEDSPYHGLSGPAPEVDDGEDDEPDAPAEDA